MAEPRIGLGAQPPLIVGGFAKVAHIAVTNVVTGAVGARFVAMIVTAFAVFTWRWWLSEVERTYVRRLGRTLEPTS